MSHSLSRVLDNRGTGFDLPAFHTPLSSVHAGVICKDRRRGLLQLDGPGFFEYRYLLLRITELGEHGLCVLTKQRRRNTLDGLLVV